MISGEAYNINKQTIYIYSAKIKNRVKGALFPGTSMEQKPHNSYTDFKVIYTTQRADETPVRWPWNLPHALQMYYTGFPLKCQNEKIRTFQDLWCQKIRTFLVSFRVLHYYDDKTSMPRNTRNVSAAVGRTRSSATSDGPWCYVSQNLGNCRKKSYNESITNRSKLVVGYSWLT